MARFIAVWLFALGAGLSPVSAEPGSVPKERPAIRPPSALHGWADWERGKRIFEKIEALAREYVVTDAAWALAYLAVEDPDKALRSLSRVADQSSAGEDVSLATITFNMFAAPVLKQPEFLELRRRLGFNR